ncbi:MAG TPA: ABC transporter substrate-binding protein [Thermomicrobiales bacterium]|nr:ABC transporter substrate-binding protein [Thermomicrobiales bacterium]
MHFRPRSVPPGASFLMLLVLLAAMLPLTASTASAQGLSCAPFDTGTPVPEITEVPEIPEVDVPDGATEITFGYTPISIFAPVFVAYEKGYFAEYGLDVTLEPLPGGSDMVLLTATGDMDIGIGGVGPAYWNAANQDLGIEIIAPGHAEGSPVASPLMISKASCEDGSITSVADLAGKRVAVNSPGATELWLDTALQQGGLTIADVDLQYLSFPDAVVALESGALDAAIIGEPLATKAEQDGIAVRLLADFPVQQYQPTVVFGNQEWMEANPEATTGVVAAYLRASRDLMENFNDPMNLAIIEKYTSVPAQLIAASVHPVYNTDGTISIESLNELQAFFRGRDLLDYDTDLDPATMVNTTYVDGALELIDG